MKKKILLCLLFLILPFSVFAAGSIKVSTTSLTVKEGSTVKFKVTASNAVGRVKVSVSDSNIATISSGDFWIENESKEITVTGKKAGNCKITVTLYDAATFDEEELKGTYTVNVKVNPKSIQNNNDTPKKEEKKTEENNKQNEEEADLLALTEATTLVETAERSLIISDYETALLAVQALKDSESKEALLARLDKVKFDASVKAECAKNECVCPEPEPVKDNSKLWMILSMLLLIGLIIETVLLIKKSNNKKEAVETL